MVGVGEDRMVGQLDRPAEVTGVEGSTCRRDDRVDAAGEVDVPLGALDGRVLPQVSRVAVEPAERTLVDRLDVVADR